MNSPSMHPIPPPRGFFGHPIGLANLFFTEMWERFSYYGMRALLVLFLVDAVQKGGYGLDDPSANAIYGLYTASVYLFNLGGGWLADRIFGAQRAVLWGGVIIAIGHIMLGFAPLPSLFYLGLMVIVVGTSLLKPNVSAMVAQLYPEGGARCDAGFTIFYMGINLGAALGPIVTAWLAQRYGWHWGFGAAAVGMICGVVQFALTRHQLGGAGREPAGAPPQGADPRRMLRWSLGLLATIAALVALMWSGVLGIGARELRDACTWAISAVALGYFAYLLLFAGLAGVERQRVLLLFVLFAASAAFWSGFEQAGSSLNLFAERYTQRQYGGLQIPAGWFQALNPIFIIVFAPVFAALWVKLSARLINPSAPVKFTFGVLGMALGFLVMALAARYVVAGQLAGPQWLTLTYLLHTFGELCLAPIGMSASSQLVPKRFVGQSLGIWFLGLSLGNLMASRMAGDFDPAHVEGMPGQFMRIVWFGLISAVLVLLIGGALRRHIDRAEARAS